MILGFLFAISMGFVLGLIGAGGSILTVPILVYLLGIKPTLATGYSLLIVGISAAFGALHSWSQGHVNLKAALLFSAPAMLTVFATRGFLLPALPVTLAGIPKDDLLMLLFATLMVLASLILLRDKKQSMPPGQSSALFRNPFMLVLGSSGIGLLTGLVGVGGGFLILPALMGLFGLSMKEAIGTSLTVISINALVGFKGEMITGIPLDWSFLFLFLSFTLFGMSLGIILEKKLNGKSLKNVFSALTLLIGVVIFIQECHHLLSIF